MPVPTTAAPPHGPDQEELDALIEEARHRARRRRLGWLGLVVAAALVGLGAYLLIGGGGNGASPASSSGDADLPTGTQSGPSAAAKAYRCPTSIQALKRAGTHGGIPGCNIHFWATLPAGWHEGPSRATVFPPRALVSEPLGPPAVRFANVPLASPPTEPPSTMPHPLPPDGIGIVISARSPVNSESLRAHPQDLRPSAFHVVGSSSRLTSASIDTGGWRFQVLLRTGAEGVQHQFLVEATTVLNSIVTTQHLCPCGRHSGPLTSRSR
jgi:hypothetical protein